MPTARNHRRGRRVIHILPAPTHPGPGDLRVSDTEYREEHVWSDARARGWRPAPPVGGGGSGCTCAGGASFERTMSPTRSTRSPFGKRSTESHEPSIAAASSCTEPDDHHHRYGDWEPKVGSAVPSPPEQTNLWATKASRMMIRIGKAADLSKRGRGGARAAAGKLPHGRGPSDRASQCLPAPTSFS
jgi:hypothetical protein